MSAEHNQIKELVKESYGARADRVINLTPAEIGHDHDAACGCSTDVAVSYTHLTLPTLLLV